MKAIQLLELYRDGLAQRTTIEIRKQNWGQKIVKYTNIEELKKEELLHHNIIDWFIGSSVTDGEIIINVEEQSMNIERAKMRIKDLMNTCDQGVLLHPKDAELFLTDKEALETILKEYEKQEDRINKAIEYMEKALLGELENEKPYYLLDDEVGQELLNILKGDK